MINFLHFITVLWSLELGMYPNQLIFNYKDFNETDQKESFIEENIFFSRFDFRWNFDLIDDQLDYFIESDFEAQMLSNSDSYDFRPIKVIWSFKTGLELQDFISINFEHTCFHPMETYNIVGTSSYNRPASEGGFNKVGVRFQF